MIIQAALFFAFTALSLAIEVQFVKRNVYIPENSCYLASIELQR